MEKYVVRSHRETNLVVLLKIGSSMIFIGCEMKDHKNNRPNLIVTSKNRLSIEPFLYEWFLKFQFYVRSN